MNTTEPTDEQIEARYGELCGMLGIPHPPVLKLTESKVSNGIALAGQYVEGRNELTVTRRSANDHVIMHELAHHICVNAVGYRGFHGVPFLVIAQIIEDHFFGGGDEISKVVCGAWSPVFSRKRTRDRAVDEANRMVLRAYNRLDQEATKQLKIWDIGIAISKNESGVALDRWTSIRWWLDAFQTQRGNGYGYLGVALMICFFACLLIAPKLPAPLNGAALFGAIGSMICFAVWGAFESSRDGAIICSGGATRTGAGAGDGRSRQSQEPLKTRKASAGVRLPHPPPTSPFLPHLPVRCTEEFVQKLTP